MQGDYGHRKMVIWKNLDQIEQLVYKNILKKIPRKMFSLIDQIDRSCSSSMANFVEGYYSGSRKEYIRFIKYSKRSLAELHDWLRRCFYREFISEELFKEGEDLIFRTIYLENRLISALQTPPRPQPS